MINSINPMHKTRQLVEIATGVLKERKKPQNAIRTMIERGIMGSMTLWKKSLIVSAFKMLLNGSVQNNWIRKTLTIAGISQCVEIPEYIAVDLCLTQ